MSGEHAGVDEPDDHDGRVTGMVERGFVLEGRVQGVGFRWWTRKIADRLGVLGTVKNLPDGTVEVMARAEESVMERFADMLRNGPASARVTGVREVAPKLSDDVDRFSIGHA